MQSEMTQRIEDQEQDVFSLGNTIRNTYVQQSSVDDDDKEIQIENIQLRNDIILKEEQE